jgi:DUF218 domain
MTNYDSILIPGGGVRAHGVLPSWSRRRMDRAVERFRGEYLIPLSAGTTHRPPPLDESGFPIYESVAAAKYLMDAGIPADRILLETQSWDTIGNAFFSRVIHAEPRNLRRLLVITSDFHLDRTRAAFEWVYGLDSNPLAFELEFEGVSDPEMDSRVERERRERERKALVSLRQLTGVITSLGDFHHWLFTGHDAYSTDGRKPGDRIPGGNLLDSY